MKIKFSIFSFFISLLLTFSYYTYGDDEDAKNILLLNFRSVAAEKDGDIAILKNDGEFEFLDKEQKFFKEITSLFNMQILKNTIDLGISQDEFKFCYYTKISNNQIVEIISANELDKNLYGPIFIDPPEIFQSFDCNELKAGGDIQDKILASDTINSIADIVKMAADIIIRELCTKSHKARII